MGWSLVSGSWNLSKMGTQPLRTKCLKLSNTTSVVRQTRFSIINQSGVIRGILLSVTVVIIALGLWFLSSTLLQNGTANALQLTKHRPAIYIVRGVNMGSACLSKWFVAHEKTKTASSTTGLSGAVAARRAAAGWALRAGTPVSAIHPCRADSAPRSSAALTSAVAMVTAATTPSAAAMTRPRARAPAAADTTTPRAQCSPPTGGALAEATWWRGEARAVRLWPTCQLRVVSGAARCSPDRPGLLAADWRAGGLLGKRPCWRTGRWAPPLTGR